MSQCGQENDIQIGFLYIDDVLDDGIGDHLAIGRIVFSHTVYDFLYLIQENDARFLGLLDIIDDIVENDVQHFVWISYILRKEVMRLDMVHLAIDFRSEHFGSKRFSGFRTTDK